MQNPSRRTVSLTSVCSTPLSLIRTYLSRSPASPTAVDCNYTLCQLCSGIRQTGQSVNELTRMGGVNLCILTKERDCHLGDVCA